MLNGNFTGNAQHSVRSINVRANLLTEWSADQGRFRREALRYSAAIIATVLIMTTSIPLLESARRKSLPGIRQHEAELSDLGVALAQADQAKKAVAPAVAASELRAQTSAYFSQLMGQTYRVLDAANSGVVFSSIKADVRAGEIAIDCKADAMSFEAAQAFGQASGIGDHKISSLASIRPGGLFGESGITFDYMKRVSVK